MIRRQTVLTVFNLCNVNFCCKKYLILSHSCIYNELPFLCNICILRSINGLLLLLLLATPRHDNPAFKKPCHCKWETYQSYSWKSFPSLIICASFAFIISISFLSSCVLLSFLSREVRAESCKEKNIRNYLKIIVFYQCLPDCSRGIQSCQPSKSFKNWWKMSWQDCFRLKTANEVPDSSVLSVKFM
jgi:hypothetical protein